MAHVERFLRVQAVLSEEELVGVEQASATAAEVSGSMMRIKLELEEKKRTVGMLQAALVRAEHTHTVRTNRGGVLVLTAPSPSPQAQQRELTVRHVKETEKELSRNFQLQKEQYEATIQRHLTFIDQVGAPAVCFQLPRPSSLPVSPATWPDTCSMFLQLINDKKALSERCEGVVGELKQVDQKYTKKIAQMQEQHEMVSQKLPCEELHVSLLRTSWALHPALWSLRV